MLWPQAHFTVVVPTFPCLCPVQPRGIGGWLCHAVAPTPSQTQRPAWLVTSDAESPSCRSHWLPALTTTPRHLQDKALSLSVKEAVAPTVVVFCWGWGTCRHLDVHSLIYSAGTYGHSRQPCLDAGTKTTQALTTSPKGWGDWGP